MRVYLAGPNRVEKALDEGIFNYIFKLFTGLLHITKSAV